MPCRAMALKLSKILNATSYSFFVYMRCILVGDASLSELEVLDTIIKVLSHNKVRITSLS